MTENVDAGMTEKESTKGQSNEAPPSEGLVKQVLDGRYIDREKLLALLKELFDEDFKVMVSTVCCLLCLNR